MTKIQTLEAELAHWTQVAVTANHPTRKARAARIVAQLDRKLMAELYRLACPLGPQSLAG